MTNYPASIDSSGSWFQRDKKQANEQKKEQKQEYNKKFKRNEKKKGKYNDKKRKKKISIIHDLVKICK